MSTDWYAKSDWSEEDKAYFFKRIKRARAQKAHIIRAKGNYLFFTKQTYLIHEAIKLYRFGLEECPDSDLRTGFYLMLARSYEALGDHSEAIQCYQKVLQLERDDSVKVRVTRAASYFALFIVVHRRSELYDEALEMLEQARSFLVEQQFIVHACRALIFDARGDNERTRAEANKAIALVDVRIPVFAIARGWAL